MTQGVVSNCILFALWRYWRRGGYIVIHKSDYGWWPHFLWSPDLVTFEQFHPVKHRRWYSVVLRARLPLPFFKGHAKPWQPKTAGTLKQSQLEDRTHGSASKQNTAA